MMWVLAGLGIILCLLVAITDWMQWATSPEQMTKRKPSVWDDLLYKPLYMRRMLGDAVPRESLVAMYDALQHTGRVEVKLVLIKDHE